MVFSPQTILTTLSMVTVSQVCFLLWFTGSLRRGLLFAISVANVQALMLLVAFQEIRSPFMLFGYLAYVQYLSVAGITAVIRPYLFERIAGRGYGFIVIGTILVSIWFVLEMAGVFPYSYVLAYVSAILFCLGLAVRRSPRLVETARRMRKEFRRAV